jgi:hypothetical protein
MSLRASAKQSRGCFAWQVEIASSLRSSQ